MGSSPSLSTLLLVGFIFHLVFVYSVFDCYFTSPVVHGMKPHNASVNGKGISRRAVLISADGLRADLLFEPNGFQGHLPPNDTQEIPVVAPYLRSIVSSRGAYGVSHTRVPTESRPGHVAMIAGMYEDVSAVTKGWKINPVEFDSVLNRSSAAWAFGSPDIVPMFTMSSQGRVREWCYDESEEDFTKDATGLDFWVLERLREVLQNKTVVEELHQPGVIFFLHLLGLDTTGHSYRPFSREYMRNIQVVDSIVREVEELMAEFYGYDNQTSFIFSADHGMHKLGNHGDGHPDNTRTPYVVWGKGLRGPLVESGNGLSSHDAYSQSWDLRSASEQEPLYRRDIEQADIASLVAALLGIDWPVNSVGVVPVDLLDPSDLSKETGQSEGWFKSRVKLVNARVILEQYRVKHELKQSRKLLYKPFSSLAGDQYARELQGTEQAIDKARSALDLEDADIHSARLIESALEGLHYLQTYERTLIRAMVTVAYTGWAAWAGTSIFFRSTTFAGNAPTTSSYFLVHILSAAVLCGMGCIFWMEHAPRTYYLYLGFPVFFWDQALSKIVAVVAAGSPLSSSADKVGNIVRNTLMASGALISMVLGYTHRSVWSIGFVLIGVIWPLLQWDGTIRKTLGPKAWLWTASCLLSAVFPLLEVNKDESLVNIMSGGFAALGVGSVILREILRSTSLQSANKQGIIGLVGVQAVLILATMFITRTSALSLQAKQGLPTWCQGAGWTLLILSLFVAFHPSLPVSPSEPIAKHVLYLRYLLGLTPLFVILSLSDETLFFVSYGFLMGLWVEVESEFGNVRREETTKRNAASTIGTRDISTYQFRTDDLRIVIFFLFFVQAAFFGTGNVASVSSFYLSPVYRLIPVFNPFFMTGLLICKIIAPFVMLAIATAAVTHALGLPPFSLFLVALCVTDAMTLIFFFNVTDTGSWLEIGQTISFFVISSLLTLWSGGVCVLGEWLMSDIFLEGGERGRAKIKSQ